MTRALVAIKEFANLLSFPAIYRAGFPLTQKNITMSKHFLLFIGCLLLAFSAQAQKDVPILLTKSYKKIKYAPEPGAKFSKIEATKSLDAKGVLKLGGKSTAKLYCNGAFKELNGKGAYVISDLFKDELQYTPMGFSNTFNGMLMAAIGGEKDKTLPGTGDGWGNKKFGIVSKTPIGKAVAGQPIVFQWQSKESLPEYEFILEDGNGKVLHSATVKEEQYGVNLEELGLKAGNAYSWKVMQPGSKGLSSNKYSFSITGKEELTKAMNALQEEEAYQQADPLLKKLMEAAWLEDAEFFYAADMAYKEAASISGRCDLSTEMRRAFEARRGE